MSTVTDNWGFTETLTNDTQQYRTFHQQALDTVKTGITLYGDGQWTGDWKLSTEDKESGDKVYVRKTQQFGNIYAVHAKINTDPATFIRINWDEIHESPKWNPNIKEFKILLQLGTQSQLVNNASEPLLGGLISSRDFVDVRVWRNIDDVFYLGARSIEYDQMPTQKGRVRAENKLGFLRVSPAEGNGPCDLVWMVCMDLKGLLPKSVVERAMNSFLLDYVRYLRKVIETGN